MLAKVVCVYSKIRLSVTVAAAEESLSVKVGGKDTLERLQVLKALVDPENLFKNHQLQGLVPANLA